VVFEKQNIDGQTVSCKVGVQMVSRKNKIFVNGLAPLATENDLKKYFK